VVGVWGTALREYPAATGHLLPVQGDFVALHGRKERFLEGLHPSKPPHRRQLRKSCSFR
jgi:hypothetical protein